MKRLAVLLPVLFSAVILLATEPVHHKAAALEGEGIYALLRRHGLSDQESVNKFYELNKMKPGDHLIAGRKYALPILVYDYDGKSIRSTIGINDWDMAIRIADFNKSLQQRGVRTSSYEQSKVLWVPYHELSSKNVQVKTAAQTRKSEAAPVPPGASVLTMRVPLFGAEHENVLIKSQKLKGKVYYIISGHGGPDPGAIGEWEGRMLCEDEYAYDVSLRLARNLMEQGAVVEIIVQDPNDGIRSGHYLKCDKDEVVHGGKPIPLNQLTRLQQRVHAVNTLHKEYRSQGMKDQTVICIHVDSRGAASRQDVFFYYNTGSDAGKRIALKLQETFDKKYAENRAGRGYSGTVSSRGLYELRHSHPKAVYVELANIQNAADLKRILPESNRQALANWLCEGLMAVK